MIAIRLSEANRHRILAQDPFEIYSFDVDAMIEHYGKRATRNAVYFVPRYESKEGTHSDAWATIPHDYLLEHFNLADPIDEMNSRFVEITHK